MPSVRDQVEAESYRRRRLVAAFVSGSLTDGAHAPRAVRCLAGGLVVSVALAGATGALAATTGRPTIIWSGGLVRVAP